MLGGVDADQRRSVGIDGQGAFEELDDMLGVIVACVGGQGGDANSGSFDGGANLLGLVEDIVRAYVGEMAAPEKGSALGSAGL